MNADTFACNRSLLFTVAYEMLGSASDAEDVVQETWLRWADVDQASVRDPRSYLVRIVTRQTLNLLRTVARRREEYVGEWLPEPLLTSPDVTADVELAENLSIAMLVVLETLSPVERVVFVLREIFDKPYDEISKAIGRSPAAVRQIAHRARDRVAARRPRMPVGMVEQQEALKNFLAAIRTGDLQSLLDVLAPDVVLVADGGGVVPSSRRPIKGAEYVARFVISNAARKANSQSKAIWLNGAPAARIDIDGQLSAAVSIVVEDGKITHIYAINNPHKLARLDKPAALTRN